MAEAALSESGLTNDVKQIQTLCGSGTRNCYSSLPYIAQHGQILTIVEPIGKTSVSVLTSSFLVFEKGAFRESPKGFRTRCGCVQ